MTSFSTRVTRLFSIAFVGLSLALLASVLVCFYVALYGSEKHELKDLARRIEGEIRAADRPDANGGSIDEAVREINKKIAFLFDKDHLNLAYAIFDKHGAGLYEYFSPGTADPFRSVQTRGDGTRQFFTHWGSYKRCMFYAWLSGERYDLLVSSTHEFDLVDTMLVGYAILLPLGILTSLGVGRVLSRRVVDPLNQIAATARRVEQGDLSARIDNPASGDEVDYVIHVLNAALQQLQSSFARIQQFSADVAHELKTPLTAMRGDLEVSLRRPRPSEEYQATLAHCLEEISDMTGLIEALLVLSTPSENEARERFNRFGLGDLLEEVREHLASYAEAEGVELKTATQADLTVLGERALIHQLVYNLLHNAIKYSDRGGVVTMTLSPAEGFALITVTDEGCGISKKDIDRIFDRLYQADPSRNVGHGLGLSIVQWISHLHGGSVEVQSEPGKGSSFVVRLPTRS